MRRIKPQIKNRLVMQLWKQLWYELESPIYNLLTKPLPDIRDQLQNRLSYKARLALERCIKARSTLKKQKGYRIKNQALLRSQINR